MKIYGIYYGTIWRNIKSGLTIFKIKEQNNKNNIISCIGYIPVYVNNMPLVLIGNYKETEYGKTFNVDVSREYISDEDIAIEFLSSGIVKGITKNMSTKLVKKLGQDIFDVVEKENADVLIKECLPRLSDDKIAQLLTKLNYEKQKRKVFYYLQKYNATYSNVESLIDEYGKNVIDKIRKNPYLICKNTNVSFYTCDLIARDERLDPYDTKRIEALIREAMNLQLNSGHCYVTMTNLMNSINYILKSSAFPIEIPQALIGYVLQQLKDYVIEKDIESRIYFKFIWTQENQVTFHINRLNYRPTALNFDKQSIKDIENECKIKYEHFQKEAFNVLKSTGIKIVTGGPGTGKTTVINGIIHAYQKMYPKNKIMLCAPTGRAAQRMSESTRMNALTVHKLLDFQPYGKEFTCKDKDNPIKADFIVVDEFSMVDICLMNLFLNAIEAGTLILFVGDENQLPSVGPGAVMRDLISSNKIETYKLKEVFRQKGASPIIINSSKIINADDKFVLNDDFEIIKVQNEQEISNVVLKYIEENYSTNDIFKTQVLCPVKKGESGVYNLNKKIQKLVNKNSEKITFGHQSFIKSDKIIMTKNNYELGYFNGDVGIVKDVFKEYIVNLIQSNDIEISGDNLEDVMLAYAMTIHKSQGSEYDNVIIVIPERNTGLNMNGLFTAVTRAKKKVTIVYEGDGLQKALKNKKPMLRNTYLKERLQGKEINVISSIEIDETKVF